MAEARRRPRDEGGTPEVVDNPALTYHDDNEAARILARLLTDEAFRNEHRQRCAERAKCFSLSGYLESQHHLLEHIVDEARRGQAR